MNDSKFRAEVSMQPDRCSRESMLMSFVEVLMSTLLGKRRSEGKRRSKYISVIAEKMGATC